MIRVSPFFTGKKNRSLDQYTLEDDEGEQVTPMSDGWYLVHHTEVEGDHWWAVRHQCPDGLVYGMAHRQEVTVICNGCKVSCPPEIGGLIKILDWRP